MKAKPGSPATIDDYIAGFPADVQRVLQRVRKTIRAAVPDAEEAISYRIPTFNLNGYLIYFAGHKHHIGVYPTSPGMKKALKGLSAYESGRGTARFSLDQPIPYALIGRMAKFRVKEKNQEAAVSTRRKGASSRPKPNATWHELNPMPAKASLDQRVKWRAGPRTGLRVWPHSEGCADRPPSARGHDSNSARRSMRLRPGRTSPISSAPRSSHDDSGNPRKEQPVTATGFHLAQVNIGRARGEMTDPVMAEFLANLPAINALADQSPGFVWRLQTEDGDATAVRPYEDRTILINLSVWEGLPALRGFVFRSAHAAIMRRRREWFERFERVYVALWWVPAGRRPSRCGGGRAAGSSGTTWAYGVRLQLQ